jgi:glycosyltransferase involved in cell wall biosynthesis
MADRQLNRPRVSITVPCYHNLAQARRCVASILAQSFTDYELTLLDDGASDEYRDYAAAIGDARVRYRRNPERLGAMRNMFQAIAAGTGEYTLAFHEDDLLGRHFLAAAVAILDRDPSCGFVCARLREFNDEASADLEVTPGPAACDRWQTPADFVRAILGGAEPMFGSVVYRRAALDGAVPAHTEYGTLVDRPFLIDVTRKWSGAQLRDPLVWYRGHPDNARHAGMSADHIVHLFAFYRSTLPQPLSQEDRALFYTYSGYWLFRLYDLTPDHQRPAFGRFLARVWSAGLYQAKWRGRFGFRLLQQAVLGRPSSA